MNPYFFYRIYIFLIKNGGIKQIKRVHWSKNYSATQALKKMFLNEVIDPDHYSGESIYASRNLFQQLKFNIFSKHLMDMTEAFKSTGGVDNWSNEDK